MTGKNISIFQLVVLFTVFIILSCSKPGGNDQKIEELIAKMSLEEKIGQMTQITINYMLEGPAAYDPILPYRLDPDSLKKTIIDMNVGSILGGAKGPFTLKQWHTFITEIQKAASETRLKIPVIYGVDAIHGGTFTIGSTIFPQQIGLAASWDTDLVKELAEITAYECRATGVPWNFSPVLDIGRKVLWSRFFETFGEDVYLTKTMGVAVIEGYQGDDPADPYHVAACMKHYLGYSVPNSGKDRTEVWMDDRILREYFLPSFEAAINANALTLMVNSGEINGIPVHANKYLLTDVLRTELGFEGVVLTDFRDIILLHKSHHVASSYKEAVKMAINAGIDMSMVPLDFEFQKYLLELVEEGEVSVSRINKSVARILKLKYQLGLFDNPVPDFDEYPKFGSEEFAKVSLKGALESITLLKNSKNTLPLDESTKILVCGPTSNQMKFLNGPWTYSWQGNIEEFYPTDKNTIYEAVRSIGGENVEWIQGTELDKDLNTEQALTLANSVDAVIICIGEEHGVEERGNINYYKLPEAQCELVKQMAATGKTIIMLINAGRPQLIAGIEDYCDAILVAYLPGNEGGDALAQIIYGKANPSGKLPFTWPKFPQTLSLYDHKYTDHNIEGKQAPYQPLYEFGYGLSYTTFEYSNLNIEKSSYSESETIKLEVDVVNTGERSGKEVVMVFVSDLYASITPPVKRLRAYKKINLEPGESKTIAFMIPVKDLAFVGVDYKWTVEPGDFIVSVNGLKEEFEVQ